MKTICELIARVASDPAKHLGARSIDGLFAYESGYSLALQQNGLPQLSGELVPDTFRDSVPEQFKDRGPKWFALLQSEDEHEAFHLFIDLRSCSLDRQKVQDDSKPRMEFGDSLFDALAIIGKRPGMYLGTVEVEKIWAFIQGFAWAERDHDIVSIDMRKIHRFESWIVERFDSSGTSWMAIFRGMAFASRLSSIAHFFAHLEMFRDGLVPDAPYRPDQEALATSLKRAMEVAKNQEDD